MKGAKCTAMAVRKPNGEIEIKREENTSIIKKYKFFQSILIIRSFDE